MISPTYGQVNMSQIVEILANETKKGPGEYNLVIGTDSQNFDTTKMVVVIALHRVGRGGIFFYEIQRIRKIDNIGQKLLQETHLSLNCAEALIKAFDAFHETTGFDFAEHFNLSIHVDAGKNGPSKQSIPEIVGWINSCGYTAVVKPDSFAASGIANKISK